MKILHIFSNWKWTGPAEHALNLALALKASGHSVSFACASAPEGVNESIAVKARLAGIAPVTGFNLNKHFNITDNLKDVSALLKFIKAENFDLVHTHMPNDHFLAGAAIRTAFSKTRIIRTCYDGEGIKGGIKNSLLLCFMTDAIIAISECAKNKIMNKCFFSDRKVWKLDTPVDLEKFNPDRIKNNREKYNIPAEAVVGGIIARVQTHRRFEVLLEALRIVVNEFPGFKFMIIGRGTHIEQIALKPSQKMGIRSNLIFTGYKNEDFVQTLACLNFKVFLMPGTDGSCRAVREAMAMGIPVIAANRGMLPEIVEHEKEGLIIDDTPENIAESILFLIEHPDVLRQMGISARQKAEGRFSPAVNTEEVIRIYKKVLTEK